MNTSGSIVADVLIEMVNQGKATYSEKEFDDLLRNVVSRYNEDPNN